MTLTDDAPAIPHLEVAYLISQYPAPSHTFIEREVEGLRRLGHRIDTFSVRPTRAEQLLDDKMLSEAASTWVLLASRAKLARDVGRAAGMHPVAVAAAIREALGTGEAYFRTRIKQLFYLAEALTLYAELERRGLRHLHVHFSNNAADIARLVVAFGRANDGPNSGWQWTMTVHGPTEFEAVAKVDLAAKVRDAAAVACISDYARSQLMRLTPPDAWHKLHRVNMSVDQEKYKFSPSSPRAGRALRVLFVGRMVPEKGPTVLVDALALIVSRGYEVEAKFVGSGPFEDEVRARLDTAGLIDRTEMLGALGQSDLPSLYQWCDVFCLPSFQEGLPVVLMEAIASGRPVVTTAIAGIPELVKGPEQGLVVAAGRPDYIADAIIATDRQTRERDYTPSALGIHLSYGSDVTAKQQETFLLAAARKEIP